MEGESEQGAEPKTRKRADPVSPTPRPRHVVFSVPAEEEVNRNDDTSSPLVGIKPAPTEPSWDGRGGEEVSFKRMEEEARGMAAQLARPPPEVDEAMVDMLVSELTGDVPLEGDEEAKIENESESEGRGGEEEGTARPAPGERRDSAWVMAHQARQAVSEWLQRKDKERARVATPQRTPAAQMDENLMTISGKVPVGNAQRVKSVGFFSFSRYDTPSKEGWLTKQGGRVKNWKRRWFILSDDRLYYYKKPGDLTPLGFIPLSRCCIRISEMRRRGRRLRYCFELYDPLGVFCRRHPAFYIFADNEEEMEEWMRALNLKIADAPAKNLRREEPVIDTHPIERQGWLTKRGGIVKNWKRRWFVLRGNMLYYYRTTKIKTPLGFIPVDRCSVELLTTDEDFKKHGIKLPARKRGFVFQITDPCSAFNRWHPSYYLMADTENDMDEWIAAICTIKLLDFDLSQITDSSPSESFRKATTEDEVLVQLSGDIDPDLLAMQYGMENRGPVPSLPNAYRFKKTSAAPHNVISTLGRHKGVTLNKRRFSMGSSSSSSETASNYSRSSSFSTSSFRLSLPEPLSPDTTNEMRHITRVHDIFPTEEAVGTIGGSVIRAREDDGEWEEKSLGLVWRNSFMARPKEADEKEKDLIDGRESSLVIIEGDEDEVEEEPEPEVDEELDLVKRREKQLMAINLAKEQILKAKLREEQARRTNFIVSMLNYLYKVLKKYLDDTPGSFISGSVISAKQPVKGSTIQNPLERKAKDELLENLFNITYDDLKYLEMLKELLQTDNDHLLRDDVIEEVMKGKFQALEEIGFPISIFTSLRTVHKVRVVSSLLLDYLASLTMPILPRYNQIINLRELKGAERQRQLQAMIGNLDRPRQRILRRLLGLMKRIDELSAGAKTGRTLTIAQLAAVLAPYIIRPTKVDEALDAAASASDLVGDPSDVLIEPSKCIDSPKPIGFPLTPRRREIVRSDWTHITELIASMVVDYDVLFHQTSQRNLKPKAEEGGKAGSAIMRESRRAIHERTWTLGSASSAAAPTTAASAASPASPAAPKAWLSTGRRERIDDKRSTDSPTKEM